MRGVVVVCALLAAGCRAPGTAGSQHQDDRDADVDEGDAGSATPADAGPMGCAGARAAYADPQADDDHDGIRNADDNCPAVANPDQANEDGDAFGDACDECPPYADDDQSDDDCDGVSNFCDPRPTTAGDRIVFFEGFNHGVPGTWQQLGIQATAVPGAIELDAMTASAVIARDGSHTDNHTLWARISNREMSTTSPAFVGVENDFIPGSDPEQGEFCFYSNYECPLGWGSTTGEPTFGRREADGQLSCERDDDTPQNPKLLGDRRDIEPNTELAFLCMEALGVDHAIQWGDHTRGAGVFADLSRKSVFDAWGHHVGFRVDHARATLEWMILIEND